VTASGTVAVGGVNILVATNGYGAHDVSNQKTWVDARISIGPNGTNKVGDAHTFTVLVEKNDGTGWTPASGVNITGGISGIGMVTGGTCLGGPTDASGTCTVVINSNVAGTAHVKANATVVVGGVSIAVATDGYGSFVNDNTKTYVDARITIGQTDTNQVGDPHTFTVFVEKNDGTGWTPASGVTIGSSKTGVGSITGGTCGPTGTTGADGKCTVIVNSNVPGVLNVKASGTVSVGGVNIAVATDGYGAHDVSNQKTYVDARISIGPNGTNPVGTPHTFTVLVEKNDGSGWTNASGISITGGISGIGMVTGGTCSSGPTDGSGTCTIIVNSNVAGTAHVTAGGTVTVGGVSIPVATDGYGSFVNNNTKTFVDAKIAITPQTADNPVASNHELTGHVDIDKGEGAGFVNAPDNTLITFSLQNTGGATATFVGGINSCNTTGGTGSCKVSITSNTAGTTTITASTTVVVSGQSLPRTTDGSGANSGPATKNWLNTDSQIATGQEYIPQDSVAVTGYGTPTGNVTFELYKGSCAGSPVYSQTVALDAQGKAVTTNSGNPAQNSGYTATGNSTWFWKVTYSGDTNNKPTTSDCVESSAIAE
jgi:hypothetical protein